LQTESGNQNFLQMLKKGSKLNSILTGSCPKCQNESMYVEKNIFKLTKILSMNDHCSHCGLKYQIEPSFFYGAMYVSYALNVAVGVAAFIISYLFFNSSMKQAFIAIIISIIVAFPYVMRLSRNIYINLFVSYDENFKQ
jgi:uncharacterized protein (DUF983 family)